MMKNDINDLKINSSDKFLGIYRGVVEDDAPIDPETENECFDGRIKVRVWGLHTKDRSEGVGIPTEHLPFAQPALPVIIGGISGKGCWSVPVQGTHVFVFFEQGNHMEPRYFAVAPGIEPDELTPDDWANVKNPERGFTDSTGNYPLYKEPDVNKLMYDNNPGAIGTTAWINVEDSGLSLTGCANSIAIDTSKHDSVYPRNFVIETRSGQTLEMNSLDYVGEDGAENVLLYHNSESYLLMKDMGDASVFIKGTTGIGGSLAVENTLMAESIDVGSTSVINYISGATNFIVGITNAVSACGTVGLPLIKCVSAGGVNILTAIITWVNDHKHEALDTPGVDANGDSLDAYLSGLGFTPTMLSSLCTVNLLAT